MSYPPPRPSYPQEIASALPTSSPLSPLSATGTPPSLPPKYASPSRGQQEDNASLQGSLQSRPPPSIPQHEQTPYPASQPQSRYVPPPAIEELWLPAAVRDKSKPELTSLLSDVSLLTALATAASTTHPSYPASIQPLDRALEANQQHARSLAGQQAQLSSLRESLTQQLLHLHALERQWRLKQAAVEHALEPWSPKAIHAGLVASIGEQEGLCKALEESFMDGNGRAGEREVADWIKRFKEGKKLLALRQERRARFEEGRVGGWR